MRHAPWLALGVVVAVQACASLARADVTRPGTQEVPLFTVSKSENKNRVQYAIHVDEHCMPSLDAPVFAYWKMLELGAGRTQPLLSRELSAYGLAGQSILDRGPEGGDVRLVLKALPARPMTVRAFRASSGECKAVATVLIHGAPAHLFDVYAKLHWPFGVAYLLLRGWSIDGKQMVQETLKS